MNIKQIREDVAGFKGRFFYDAERGDIGYIAKDCDEGQCDCEENLNADGDQDCSVSLFDIDDVEEPVVRMLNAVPTLLAENERLRTLAREAIDIAVMSMNHLDRNAEAKANRLAALTAELGKEE